MSTMHELLPWVQTGNASGQSVNRDSRIIESLAVRNHIARNIGLVQTAHPYRLYMNGAAMDAPVLSGA